MPRKNSRNTSVQTKPRSRERDESRRNGGAPSSPKDSRLLQALLEGLNVGVANVTHSGEILFANSRFTEMLLNAADDRVIGANLMKFVSAGSWPAMQAALAQAMFRPASGEMKVETASHHFRSMQLSLSPVHSGNETTVMITATEVTELVEKNKALHATEEALHALSARILQLQDEERRRIARDLHDITGQELAVVIMSLNRLAGNLSNPAVNGTQILAETVELVRKVEDEIRTVSYLLHPPLLDEFGLGSALNWYVEGFSKRTGIAVSVETPRNLPRFSIEKETALFRVVQESLTNVMRHSRSLKARIRLWLSDGTVHLSVDDEGKGIGREALTKIAEGTASGVGTSGMRERLQQLGGSLTVRPRAKGTQVIAALPVEKDTDAVVELERAAGHPSSHEELPHSATGRNAKKRILIVDDHEVTRQGLKTLLKDEPGLEICGEAQDGLEALVKTSELNPDLIIMDISMPGAGGFSAASAIRNSGARAKILFFTTYTHTETERMSRIGGFAGLVTKTNAARDLVRGVRAVLAGHKFFGSEVVDGGGKSRPRGNQGRS